MLRKKLTKWRVITILALVGVALAVTGWSGTIQNWEINKDHIARITISGTIVHDPEMLELIRKVKDDENVKAVVLAINSPGGTTVGGETIYNAVRELADAKPTVTSAGTITASAAYMIAVGSDYIVAHNTSIVGSIGVLLQYPQVDEMLNKIGVKFKEIKSSPLKAAPSPFTPDYPEANEMVQRVVDDTYKWFTNIVANRRGLNNDEIKKVADGSIFSGNQALKVKLVDEIGGEDVAVKWLIDNKNIDEDIKVVDRKKEDENPFNYITANMPLAKNTEIVINSILKNTGLSKWINNKLVLDGLISIWQN